MYKPFVISPPGQPHFVLMKGSESDQHEPQMRAMAARMNGEFRWVSWQEYNKLGNAKSEVGRIFGMTEKQIANKQGIEKLR